MQSSAYAVASAVSLRSLSYSTHRSKLAVICADEQLSVYDEYRLHEPQLPGRSD